MSIRPTLQTLTSPSDESIYLASSRQERGRAVLPDPADDSTLRSYRRTTLTATNPPPTSRVPAPNRATLPTGVPPVLGVAFLGASLACAFCAFAACLAAFLADLSSPYAITGTAATTNIRIATKRTVPTRLNCILLFSLLPEP
jgi:hypothetical protein